MLGNTHLLSSKLNENVLSKGREKRGRGWVETLPQIGSDIQ
jgi:hypothetical protein